MTLLITGGTGFLGSYFTRYALQEGGEDHVVVLDRHAERGRIADVLDRVTLIEGDVADPETVRAVIADHGVDRIAHYAFMLGSPAPGKMLSYVDVQCLGTANVYESARLAGVKRVLFTSSVNAYGKQAYAKGVVAALVEAVVPDPDSPYGICKRWGELMGRHYKENLGLDVVTVRFGSVYGFGRARRGSYNSDILAPMDGIHYMARVEEAVRGRAIEMPDDEMLADFTYAADAAQAAWLALNAKRPSYDLYNVKSEQLPVGHYTQTLRELLPDIEINVAKSENVVTAHRSLDNGRLVDDLGFQPRYNLRRGLEDYIERVSIFDSYHRSIP